MNVSEFRKGQREVQKERGKGEASRDGSGVQRERSRQGKCVRER